jgi:RHS repeat-associated protein
MKCAFPTLIVTAGLLACAAALAEEAPTVTVAITAPANGAVVSAPGPIEISAAASVNRRNWPILRVTFYSGTRLIGTATAAPYRVTWIDVPAGRHTLTARAVATNPGQARQDPARHANMPTWEAVSAPVILTVNAPESLSQMYYIHSDHLNTPRRIYDQAGQEVWRWDNTEPFGDSLPNENPSGLGTFTCNLRLPGQYFDKETNLHYNMARDYDPAIGRYIQSDPIGLDGGINTYTYVKNSPLSFIDPRGLDLVVTFYPGTVVDHVGIGVNSPNTYGQYPRERGIGVVFPFCRDVPGRISQDRYVQDQRSQSRAQSVVIKTTPLQDAMVQQFIENARTAAAQGNLTYNLCYDQCTRFVIDALSAGGVGLPRFDSVRPKDLFDILQQSFGTRR